MANRYYCRFTNVIIPNGADIRNAFVRFVSYDEQVSATLRTNVHFVDADDPDAPADKAELDGFSLTSGVAWDNLPKWYDGVEYQTPDLSTQLESVVGRAGWISGNALLLVIEDDGSPSNIHRKLGAFEYLGHTERPVLSVGWFSELDTFFDPTRWEPAQLNVATGIETSWDAINSLWDFNIAADSNGGRLQVKGTWHRKYQPSRMRIQHTHGGAPELKVYAADGIVYHSVGYTSGDWMELLWANRSEGIYRFEFLLADGDDTPFDVTEILFDSTPAGVQTTTSTSSTASTTSSSSSTASTTSTISTTSSTASTASTTSSTSSTASTTSSSSTTSTMSSTSSSSSTATTASTHTTFSTTSTCTTTHTSTSTTTSSSTTASTTTTTTTSSSTSSTASTTSTSSSTSSTASTLSTTSTTSTSSSTSSTASTTTSSSSTASSTSTQSTTTSTHTTVTGLTTTSSSTTTTSSTASTSSTSSSSTSTISTISTTTTAGAFSCSSYGSNVFLIGNFGAASSSGDAGSPYEWTNIFDLDTETMWIGDGGSLAWWQVDYASAKTINKLRIYFGDNLAVSFAPSEMKFMVSDTGVFGGEEIDLVDVTGLTWTQDTWQEWEFANTNNELYYRVLFVDSDNGSWVGASLFEMMECED